MTETGLTGVTPKKMADDDRESRRAEYQKFCREIMDDKIVCDECGKDEGYDLFYGSAGDKIFGKCRSCGWLDHFGYTG